MDIDLRQLRALVAVVDEGTFTDAAIALGTSQATISRRVASLERELGFAVLRRTSRDVAPTAAGLSVLPYARQALAAVAAIITRAEVPTGEVRIGFGWAALGKHTIAVQRRWAQLYPGSELIFVQSSHRTVGLTDGTVDVAVVRRPIEDRRLASVDVGQERRFAALPSDDPLARRRRLHMDDFTERVMGIETVLGTTSAQMWAGRAGPASFRRVQGTDEWLTLIAAGQGVGITPEATVEQFRRPGVVYRPVVDAPPLTVRLIWRRADPPTYLENLRTVIEEAYRIPQS